MARPGIDLDLPREGRPASRIFALPGVPAEMNEMWTATVAPILRELAGGKSFCTIESNVSAWVKAISKRCSPT